MSNGPYDQVNNPAPTDAPGLVDAQGDTTSRLQADYHNTVGRVTDRTSTSTTDSGTSRFDNPYVHISIAANCIKELHDLAGRKANDKITIETSPGHTREITVAERRVELTQAIEKEYPAAIKAADSIQQTKVTETVWELQNQEAQIHTRLKANGLSEQQIKNNPEYKHNQTLQDEVAVMRHAPAVARLGYAQFLLESKNDVAGAKRLLDQALASNTEAQHEPNMLAFYQTLTKADQALTKYLDKPAPGQLTDSHAPETPSQKPFDNPYAHYQQFQDELKAGHLDQAEKDLKEAVKAAHSMDCQPFKDKLKELDQKLAATKEGSDERKSLEAERNTYDQLAHAEAFMNMQLGRVELANKNFLAARSLFMQVQKDDPDFANRPTTQMKELLEASKEPSRLSQVLGTALNIGKSLLCDGAAVLAGAGAVILTGWSGPGAVLAGGAAGTATYLAMRGLLFHEKPGFDKQTAENVGWGFVDGVSGGVAGLTRAALLESTAGLASKEIAEQAVLKTGGRLAAQNIAALQAVEAAQGGARGLKYFGAAEQIAKEGLAQAGKGFSAAELKEAKAALRALSWRNSATKAAINAGTAASMSLVYRGAHEGVNYYEGKYKTFGEFSKSLAGKVAIDTAAGVGLGAAGTYLGAPRTMSFDFLGQGASAFVATSPFANQLAFGTLPEVGHDLSYRSWLNTPTSNYDEWMSLYGQAPGYNQFTTPTAPTDSPSAPDKANTDGNRPASDQGLSDAQSEPGNQ